MKPIRKYPRTPHLTGSRRQPGDEDMTDIGFEALAHGVVVVEEKLDGANAAISFDQDGALLLQSRGHYLDGGPRERHFDLFKRWAAAVAGPLFAALGERYVLYGEWLYAKHTMFYDALPHYFLEFDVLDRKTEAFLSTPARRRLLAGLPLVSVPVIHEGAAPSPDTLAAMIGPARFRTPVWRGRLAQMACTPPQRPELVMAQSDGSDLMEGLYVKLERDDHVAGRFKYVRADFLTAVADSEGHWLARPILPNLLAPGVDIFAFA